MNKNRSTRPDIDTQTWVTAMVVAVICALISATLLISYFASVFTNWPVS